MKKLILIGGGDIGRGNTKYETKKIDEEIVKLTEKENPTFLFIGLASSFADSYYDIIKKIYQNLGCKTVYLKKSNLVNNPKIVEDKINSADIIYVGGGDSIKLLDYVKEYNLKKLLQNAYDRGCVMAGISAGAILFSNKGYSDSYILRGESDKHKFIKGLNFFDIDICPHFIKNSLKHQELKKDIKDKETIYALENNTALKIIDRNILTINKNIFKCSNNSCEVFK